jgi:carboxyl-terminal processing protease
VTVNQDGHLQVITPIDDTPGAEAGIKPGDLIIKVGDESIYELPINESVELIRGPVGTVVELTIKRRDKDKPFVVNVKRSKIKIITVKTTLHGHIPVFRISAFNETTTNSLRNEITQAQKQADNNKLPGLILDLRNNPGGLLTEAIDVSGLFFDGATLIVTSKGRVSQKNESFYTDSSSAVVESDTPIVVLINGGSASASEIVAGALQHYKKATIIGERSFGKGSVQSLITLGEVGLKLTTSLYYTPDNQSVQGKGITPDIVVPEMSVVERENRYEEDLTRALEVENSTEPDVVTSKDPDVVRSDSRSIKTPMLEDVQLLYALYYINKMIDESKG